MFSVRACPLLCWPQCHGCLLCRNERLGLPLTYWQPKQGAADGPICLRLAPRLALPSSVAGLTADALLCTCTPVAAAPGLLQAENVLALVNARTAAAADSALAGLQGGLGQLVSELRADVLSIITELEARLDFDEDLPPLDVEQLKQDIAGERLPPSWYPTPHHMRQPVLVSDTTGPSWISSGYRCPGIWEDSSGAAGRGWQCARRPVRSSSSSRQ